MSFCLHALVWRIRRETFITCDCFGDMELDSSFDVLSMFCDDTPVHILIPVPEWSHSYSEDSLLLVISDEISLPASVPGGFHHYSANGIQRSPAPVLCVTCVLMVILTMDSHRSSVCCGHHPWSGELTRAHCLLCQPDEEQNCGCRKRRTKITWSELESWTNQSFPCYSVEKKL